MPRRSSLGLFNNGTSLLGLIVAAVSAIGILFLFIVDLLLTHQRPYVGIFTYMVLPAVLVLGIAIAAVGALRERRRLVRGGEGEVPPYPRIDLNDPRQRRTVALAAVGLAVFVLMSVYGSYRAYEFTDSVGFCGLTCHSVMKPEYTAYQASPHARVTCVNCHVGSGAGWYVRSKASGLYQVYAVTTNSYPRPIPTPIENLRPAQETCEQCHWPAQFYGAVQKVSPHFLPDERNTRWDIRLLVKVGGGQAGLSTTEGIHWHMNIANEVRYVATDRQRQKIAWVRVENRTTGAVIEYVAPDAPKAADLAQLESRRMDCMDCHNRPTHIFPSPNRAVNEAMGAGRIDPSLPWIKAQAVKALIQPYPTEAAAYAGIEKSLREFYAKNKALPSREAAVRRAIAETQAIYSRTIFPGMKVSWRAYGDNIGHLESLGCMRCHNGTLRSADGRAIRSDCTICHAIVAQGPAAGSPRTAVNLGGLEFRHPEDIGDEWKTTPCSDCHDGTAGQ